jgi:hypothetical protein
MARFEIVEEAEELVGDAAVELAAQQTWEIRRLRSLLTEALGELTPVITRELAGRIERALRAPQEVKS